LLSWIVTLSPIEPALALLELFDVVSNGFPNQQLFEIAIERGGMNGRIFLKAEPGRTVLVQENGGNQLLIRQGKRGRASCPSR